ncbi:MAG: ADOP family duplicated permease, partial [Gemmatimonadaceae bacterium]
ANTALFGIVDRVMFRAPAYIVDADRVHRPFVRYRSAAERRVDRVLEYTRYQDLTRWTSSFDRTAVMAYRRMPVGSGEGTREMPVVAVSASLFGFFAAPPVIGHYFVESDDQLPTGRPVAVLGHAFWQSRFGGHPDVVGQPLQVDRTLYTIIGVAPEGFAAFSEEALPAVFVPVTTIGGARNDSYYRNYEWSWLEMFVHRKPGVSLEQANADLTAAYRRSWMAEHEITPLPDIAFAQPGAELAPLPLARTPDAGGDSRTLVWVMGVAGIVLLIACANVANLMLARALKRRREIGVRLALGVSRRRLAQQLLVETVLLGSLGGAFGLILAQWGARTLAALFLPGRPAGVASDPRTLLFAIALTLCVAIATGLAPAFQSFRYDLAGALRAGSRDVGYRRSRLRSGLLLFQGALCVMLLVGAGVFSRSLWHVRAMRLGYDVEPIVFAEVNLRGLRLTNAELALLNDRVLAAAQAIPGVTHATLTVSVPFWSNEGRRLFVTGRDSVWKLGRFLLQAGSTDYFETMGTRILRGRDFTDADRENAERVVVVTEGMARVLWPDQDAIGKHIRIGSDTADLTRVIGIAEDTRARLIAGDPEYWYYLPVPQYNEMDGPSHPAVFARVAGGDAANAAETVRRAIQSVLPGAAYVNASPLGNLVSPTQRAWEFGATMFLGFGALALILAGLGLYSVIAYAVAQRTQELGVRIALGASIGALLRMIVGQGVAFGIAGILIGSVLALWAGRWLQPLLFEQSARDPVILLSVAAVLLLVAVIASIVPAVRATRVDPTTALRAE